MKINLYIILCLLPILASGQCVGTAGQVTWSAWLDLYDDEIGELVADEYYPNNPDASITIYKLQSPINYADNLGGRIAGYISVPSEDTITFNITGDDKTRFYLSTDENPENKVLQAYTDQWSNILEHDKFPTQTSAAITLTSGVYYYFELLYAEGGGGDHVSLYWKTIHEDPDNWTLINANYINAVDCLPAACPERNTPCDDNNASTMDDKEDGHCNCIGTPNASNTCLGPQYEITSYAYDSIPGNDLNDLYNATDFPGMPDGSFELDELALGNGDLRDSTGTLVQGYLTVPVTGTYKFNVTGNNETIFFLSSNDDPANKQATQILVTSSTDPTEHNKYIYQTSAPLSLTAGQLYYYELNHKEGAYTEHFSVFWQTPFTTANEWKRISDFYLYDYTCEIACIAAGTTCDDGNPFTNNDMYDSNCQCIGTPCSGPACNDPLASYIPYDKCNTTDQLDNRADNNWLSCSTDTNPNGLRADSHWIQYDLGQNYNLGITHVWNYNVPNETANGFQSVAIDYSLDGNTWTELGIYTWSLADGSPDYSGFIGPDFYDAQARYILITSLDPGAGCKGFGKILFNASYCPTVGQPCDDGDPLTFNEVWDDNCNCIGNSVNLNACNIDSLVLGDTLLYSDIYSAIQHVNSQNLLDISSDVKYVSGQDILLDPGFEVPAGTQFEALIEACVNSTSSSAPLKKREQPLLNKEDRLHVIELPSKSEQLIEFHALDAGHYTLTILDANGKVMYTIFDHDIANKGIYTKRITTKKIAAGVYTVILYGPNIKEIERMTVL